MGFMNIWVARSTSRDSYRDGRKRFNTRLDQHVIIYVGLPQYIARRTLLGIQKCSTALNSSQLHGSLWERTERRLAMKYIVCEIEFSWMTFLSIKLVESLTRAMLYSFPVILRLVSIPCSRAFPSRRLDTVEINNSFKFLTDIACVPDQCEYLRVWEARGVW